MKRYRIGYLKDRGEKRPRWQYMDVSVANYMEASRITMALIKDSTNIAVNIRELKEGDADDSINSES